MAFELLRRQAEAGKSAIAITDAESAAQPNPRRAMNLTTNGVLEVVGSDADPSVGEAQHGCGIPRKKAASVPSTVVGSKVPVTR